MRSYSTSDGELQHIGWGFKAHCMGSYSTKYRELQHNGWIKLNAEAAAGRCRNIFWEKRDTSRHRSTFPKVFIFQCKLPSGSL
jgi:hypothetical protein